MNHTLAKSAPFHLRQTTTKEERTARTIIDYVALAYDLPKSSLRGPRRNGKIPEARHVAIILIQHFTRETNRVAAGYLRRDASIAFHARAVVSDQCEVNPTFKSNLAKMTDDLTSILKIGEANRANRAIGASASFPT